MLQNEQILNEIFHRAKVLKRRSFSSEFASSSNFQVPVSSLPEGQFSPPIVLGRTRQDSGFVQILRDEILLSIFFKHIVLLETYPFPTVLFVRL